MVRHSQLRGPQRPGIGSAIKKVSTAPTTLSSSLAVSLVWCTPSSLCRVPACTVCLSSAAPRWCWEGEEVALEVHPRAAALAVALSPQGLA